MRILLTGAEGYIGRKIFKEACKKHVVLPIDAKRGISIRDAMHPKGSFFKETLNFNADCIIHTAATPRISYSIENPLFTMENNVLSTSICLNFCKISRCKKIILSSSSSAKYPDMSPYAFQKKTSENEAELYRKLYGIKTYSLRYFNVYSEYSDYIANDTVLSKWMKACKSGEKIVINGDGFQRRDMVHLDDVVKANMFFAENDLNVSYDHYDIGTGSNISINELSEMFTSRGFEVEYAKARSSDMRESMAIPRVYTCKNKIGTSLPYVIGKFFKDNL